VEESTNATKTNGNLTQSKRDEKKAKSFVHATRVRKRECAEKNQVGAQGIHPRQEIKREEEPRKRDIAQKGEGGDFKKDNLF